MKPQTQTAKHTPGTVRIWRDMDPKEPLQILGMETDFICSIAMENTNAQANAQRIVQVWNQHDQLIAQRDALLQSVRDMVHMIELGDEHGVGSAWHIQARDAIALCEPKEKEASV